MHTIKRTVEAGKGSNTTTHASINGMHRELMRLPDSHQSTSKSNHYAAGDNDDFIESESDRQMLLIKCVFFPFFISLACVFELSICLFPTLNWNCVHVHDIKLQLWTLFCMRWKIFSWLLLVCPLKLSALCFAFWPDVRSFCACNKLWKYVNMFLVLLPS